MTKKEYEQYINETTEYAFTDYKERPIKNYGTWLRKNDPICFEVIYDDFKREKGI